jgi:tripartite-type tricarboxylate transporter receptor subunit TctC
MQDLVAGQIDLMFDQASNALPHVRNKAIRAYAVTARTRLASAPDIPTVDEAGLPGFHIAIWRGFWAPRSTPPTAIARLGEAVVDALADPHTRARITDLGQDIPAREDQTAARLRAIQEAEIAKWWPIIKAANIKAE